MVPIGATHISLPLQEYNRGSGRKENKTNKTNNMLGVNSSAEGELCNTLCMCRLTLAWVTSETSTKQLECRLILTRSSFTGLDPISSDWSHRSGVRCRLPLSVVSRQLPVCSFVQPTLFSRPLPLPVTVRFQVQNPLSGFTPKQTKESSAWRATYIMLHETRTLLVYVAHRLP